MMTNKMNEEKLVGDIKNYCQWENFVLLVNRLLWWKFFAAVFLGVLLGLEMLNMLT